MISWHAIDQDAAKL